MRRKTVIRSERGQKSYGQVDKEDTWNTSTHVLKPRQLKTKQCIEHFMGYENQPWEWSQNKLHSQLHGNTLNEEYTKQIYSDERCFFNEENTKKHIQTKGVFRHLNIHTHIY